MNIKKTFLGLLAAASLAACGDTGNAAGGGIFRVNDVIAPDGAVNTTCIDGDLVLVQSQFATAELANVAVRDDVEPPDIVLQSYRLDYFPMDGGPDLAPHDYPFSESVLVPANGTAQFGVEFMPVKTKREFFQATTGTTSFRSTFFYEARYEFIGESAYGDKVEAQGSTTFSLGNNYIVDCD
jgi:hypothetical protein